jgi:hypothetical protein
VAKRLLIDIAPVVSEASTYCPATYPLEAPDGVVRTVLLSVAVRSVIFDPGSLTIRTTLELVVTCVVPPAVGLVEYHNPKATLFTLPPPSSDAQMRIKNGVPFAFVEAAFSVSHVCESGSVLPLSVPIL